MVDFQQITLVGLIFFGKKGFFLMWIFYSKVLMKMGSRYPKNHWLFRRKMVISLRQILFKVQVIVFLLYLPIREVVVLI